MRLEETVLRPGEFAIYLDTNRSVDLGRLLTFLECFRWTSDDGIVPAYDLEIIDLQKKCIFARFGFKWRDGKGPDEGRFSKMEREIQHLREQLDNTAVRSAAAAEAQVEIARKSLKVTGIGVAATAAIGALGLILDVARDARSDQTNQCAAAIADLMEHDAVASIKIWSPDCTILLEQRDLPEIQRREQRIAGFADGTASAGTAIRSATADNSSGSPTAEDATQAPDIDDGDFIPTMVLASSNDPRKRRPRGVDGARPAGPTLPHEAPINGRLTTIEGRARRAGSIFIIEMDPEHGRSMFLLPPEGQIPVDKGRYQVTGRVFSPSNVMEIMSAQTMQPLE